MSRTSRFALAALGLFVALIALDQWRSTDPFDARHLLADMVEKALLAGGVIAAGFVSVEAREMREERRALIDDLAATRRDSERWRAATRAHVDGLSQAIAAQFAAWSLTEAESDIAALMLKGLAHKEIAALRLSSEATVRQHATSVYRKSGLGGRTQLTAFFLEDLLGPGGTSGAGARSGLAVVGKA